MRTVKCDGHVLRAVLNLAAVLVTAIIVQGAPTITKADACQKEITNAGNGTVLLARDWQETVRRCTWTVGAPPGHRLMVIVNEVNLHAGAVLVVTLDGGVSHNFSGQCDSCVGRLEGKSLSVVYDRGDVDSNGTSIADPPSSDVFSIGYRSFDPAHCPPPVAPSHGRVMGRDRRVGSRVTFRCNPPYVVAAAKTERVTTEATCVILTSTSPLPSWSVALPVCALPECGKTPIALTAGVADADDVAVVVHPGFPGPFVARKTLETSECVWEVSTGRKKHLVVSVEKADLPDHVTLELYDGRTTDRRRLDGTTDPVTTGASYATVGKLVVILRSGSSNEATGDNEHSVGAIEDYGFRLKVTARKTPCGAPVPPVHGDVRGSAIVTSRTPTGTTSAATSSTPASTNSLQMKVFYSCDTGFQLTGASNSSLWCADGAGEFTSVAPLCVALSPIVPSPNESPAVVETAVVNVSTQPVDLDTKVDNVSDAVPISKLSRPRTSKDRRPHPQSTEEKTNVKAGKGEEDGAKPPVVDPAIFDWSPTMTSLRGEEDREDVESYDGGDAFDEKEGEGGDPGGDAFLDDTGSDGLAKPGDEEGNVGDFPVVAVALGVALPVLLITLAVAAGLAYRRLYPVRMNMGRKFDTFENPVYNKSKRDPNTTGTLLPGASLETPLRPAEMQRLMTNRR